MRKALYILGTRGIPAAHGGFETFAQDLALYMAPRGWDVIVYCQSDRNETVMWQGITCHHIAASNTTLGTAIFDLKALLHCMRQDGVMLTLGYNTGLLNVLPKLGKKKQIINMDGIEWQRGKWSAFYKAVFFFNYCCAGMAGDILIADNPGIDSLLRRHFRRDKIRMIPYGSNAIEQADVALIEPFGLPPQNYAVVIARPEPENGILEIVTAWSQAPRQKKLVVLGRFDETNDYHCRVKHAASAEVIFPGAVYDGDTVKALRFHAAFYLHGHTVGGTNPSLVEALGAGNAVIAHDNVFNRWTAGEAALYFKDQNDLTAIFNRMDKIDLTALKREAALRHQEAFQLNDVLGQYEKLCGEALTA